MSYNHILVAVDLSKSSEIVINKAVALAKATDSKLSFIYVDAMYISNIAFTNSNVDKVVAEEKEKSVLQKELQALADQADYPVANSIVVMGDVAEKLTTTVKKMDVDLLVCGHHHDFWSWLLSSVRNLVNITVTDLLIVSLDK